jgi:hypothetical protein
MTGASLVGALLMDRLLPDPLPVWLTVALFAVVIVGAVSGLGLALWPEEKKMDDKKMPLTAVVGNQFIGGKIIGGEIGIQIVNGGDGYVADNSFNVEMENVPTPVSVVNAGRFERNKFDVRAKNSPPKDDGEKS